MRYILLLAMVSSLAGCCSVPPGTPPPDGEPIIPPVIEVAKVYTPEQAVDNAVSEFFQDWLLVHQDPKPKVSPGMPDIDNKTFFEYQLAALFVNSLKVDEFILTGEGVDALALRATRTDYRLKGSNKPLGLVRFTLTSPTGVQLWQSSVYPIKP